MNTTKILGEAVGIQSQGTVDKTETQTKEGLTSALIVGRFKRGRVDKPMTIHQGNIRGQLGYEPTNIDYQAVQDCLDTGVPSVQVLRVGQMVVDPEVPHIISCEGATENIGFFITGNWQIYIDDEIEPFVGVISNALSQLLSSYSGKITGDWDGSMFMQNIDNIPHRFRFVPIDENVTHGIAANNPTFIEHMDGSLTFCLAITPVDQDLYTPAILALNPVAYYLMSETAGSVLNDSSLSGFEGEIQETSAISYKADPLRKGSQGSMGFNIASNWTTAQCYVSDAVAGDTFKKLAASESSCTIAFWLKPESPRTYNWLAAYVLDKDSGTANYRVMAYNSYNIVGQSPHNQNQVISNETLGQMLGKNQFIVWRKDAATNTYSLTVNGVTNTVSGISNDASTDGLGFFFPMSAGYSFYGLRGYMSDMSVFDYALTDAQIANLYQKGRIV